MGLRGLSRGASTIAVLLTVGVGSASAATLTVTTTTDETTSGDHQCSLREAVAAVDAPATATDCGTADNAGNTIALGPTTYTLLIPTAGSDDNSTGDLDVHGTTGLRIAGAGLGVTTISGSAPLKDRLLNVVSGGVTLQNLTLKNGHAPDGADGVGSALTSLPPTAGKPGSDGGAISNSGTLSLDHVVVTNNSAGKGGIGGSANPSAPSSPGATGGNGGRGGGIYNAPATALNLTDVTLSANRSGNGGTGGSVGGTTAAGGNGGCCGDGGGLFNDGGSVHVDASTFSQNIAGDGGSGGFGGSPITSGNAGTGGSGAGGASGGAIATVGGALTIINSTISGNLSGSGGNGGDGGIVGPGSPQNGAGGNAGNGSGGGGLFARASANVSLANITIADNESGGPGAVGSGNPSDHPTPGTPAQAAGVLVSGATVTAKDTLLASNAVANCGGSTVVDAHNNLSFGASGCPGTFSSGDPRLGPLHDNGGPTQTMALGVGSAAVDAGSGCPSTDQRGAMRPSGPACDIGAYEFSPPAVTTGAASAVTSSDATLNGSVTPNQSSATVRFEYGTTTAYGTTTPGQQFGGFSPSSVSIPISGLNPNTIYHYRLVATSPDGTATGTDQTFTTGAGPTGPAGGATAPTLAHLSLKPSSFRTSPRKRHRRDKTGTTLSYTASQASSTTFTVFKCTKVKKRRCTHYARVGSFSHRDSAGHHSFHWSGAVGRKRLTPGRYRLVASASSGRLVSRPLSALFTVVN